MKFIQNLLAWAKKNERHISTLVYVAGFVSDIFTFLLVSIAVAYILFSVYIVAVAICILGNYLFVARGYDQKQGIIWKVLNVLLPLGVQFFTGNLLSGFLIFYTKSAFVFASWPFLLVLAAVFIGNELFRDFRSHLAFQTTLFFFALYTYLIFALPLLLHSLSPLIFLESTLATIGIFAILISLLAAINLKRLAGAWITVLAPSALIVAIVVGSYFAGLIPPIPLTLSDSDIYHGIERVPGGYEVQAEAAPTRQWWQFGPLYQIVVHVAPGDSLVAYSSVFAPTNFGTSVIHEWEVYDTVAHSWKTRSVVPFAISGGRNGGYRGYSILSNVQPGKYRVSIETASRQVIGRIEFTAIAASSTPSLHTERK